MDRATGEYQLQAGMYDITSGKRLPFHGRNGKRPPGNRGLFDEGFTVRP